MMDESVSKSQKKRDAESLQKLGIELVSLSLEKLESLPLTDDLRRALIEAKALRSHGAVRRQAQLIGKLMRSADYEAIRAGYDAMQAEDNAMTARFHEVEHWRDRLIHEDRVALTEFVDQYPSVDVQHLRQLVKKAVEEKKTARHPGAGKALFRYLRPFLL